MKLEQPFVLLRPLLDSPCRSHDPPAAVSDGLPSNYGSFVQVPTFVMSLASNGIYSLFAGPRHLGVVTTSTILQNDG